jgi:hypothetical protein
MTAQYWKIAPGEKGRKWTGCRDGKFIAVDWDYIGDVTHLSQE